MSLKEGEYVRWYEWPKGVWYEILWDVEGTVCLNMPGPNGHPNPVMHDKRFECFWMTKEFETRGAKKVADPNRFTKAIEHKRGDTFSCIVGMNPYTDHISFHKIVMPEDAKPEIKEAFLEEAEKILLKIVDKEWDQDVKNHGM